MRVAIALLLSVLPMLAQAIEVGEPLKPWTLLDQHDQAYSLNPQTRILLVARDMDGSKLVKSALQDTPKAYLDARQAVFVADIQRMPALISQLFAIPAMRDYNYRVLLDREGRVATRYSVTAGQIVWLQLENGRLISRQAFTSGAELRRALDSVPH